MSEDGYTTTAVEGVSCAHQGDPGHQHPSVTESLKKEVKSFLVQA